ncbi:MAG: rhodanese-like domain-containing protein [Candidatus Promineifilaceae bacterium]|nr:rhodanese-like domain-containing protein [Candidatus Promineifilaceae bacterium]
MTIKITTAELAQALDDPTMALVDIRPIAAYNGWRLADEARGGHIPGAAACPLSWTAALPAADLRAMLVAKGVTPDKRVIIYGYTDEDSEAVAERLLAAGYDDVRVYGPGLAAWAADPQRPMERLARYQKLIHPAWLAQLLAGEQPEQYDGRPYRLFHVSYDLAEEYEQGHIPGAVHLDTLALESPQSWNRRSAEELGQALREHGIRHDQTVVLYGRDADPNMSHAQPGRRAGQIAATRAAAILMYAGVADVRLLDGGLDAWLAAGLPLEKGRVQPQAVADFGATIPGRPEFMVDLDEAKALLGDRVGSALVSIRSWREYVGDTSGYHYIRPRGRIAGAIWGNCGTDAYHMQHYRNPDNTMRAYPEIVANWQSAGITADKRVAFYCGTGWRASEAYFYAYLLGWERVAVYDGGWFEWSADENNPIEYGEPPQEVVD